MRTLVFLVVFGFLFVAGFVMVESTQPIIKFAINGTRFLMDENGSIGIGTDTPVGALAVNGTTNLTGRAYYNGSEICTADNALCTGVQAESDPLWSANSSTVARAGTCAAGYVVQNTTATGVQCVPDQTSSVSGFGNMSQWRLDADTGTTATVLNNTLVQIVSGTGISTSIVGFDVFIENTGDTNAADDFSGAWSALTGKPAGFSDDVDNDTTYTNGTGILLNGNQFNISKAYTDTLYAPISVTGDNASWNESRGNAIYLGISATAANSVLFGSQNTAYYLNTTGGTYDNRTFNQTLTDSLYYPRNTNPQSFYNSSTLPSSLDNYRWQYNTSGNATNFSVTNNTLVRYIAGTGLTINHIGTNITFTNTVIDTNNGGVSNYTVFSTLNNSVVWNTNGTTANVSINISYLAANCALITGSATLCDGSDDGAAGGDNASWNQSYAETLYYPRNTNPQEFYNVSTLPAYPTADNTSWNESRGNAIYYLATNPSNYITDGNTNWDNSYGFIANGTQAWLSLLNVTNWVNASEYYTRGTLRISSSGVGSFAALTTIDGKNVCLADGTNCPASSGDNSSWNQSYANTLYYGIDSNIHGYLNSSYNSTYATGIANLESANTTSNTTNANQNTAITNLQTANATSNTTNTNQNTAITNLQTANTTTNTSTTNLIAKVNTLVNLTLTQVLSNGFVNQSSSVWTGNITRIDNLVTWNATLASRIDSIGNWSLDKSSYATNTHVTNVNTTALKNSTTINATTLWINTSTNPTIRYNGTCTIVRGSTSTLEVC